MERDLQESVGFARLVLEQVLVGLQSEDPTTRTRQAERWAAARLPAPGSSAFSPSAGAGPEATVLWAIAATRSEHPEERFAAARVLAAMSWAAVEADLEEEAGALMAALGEVCLPIAVPALDSSDPLTRRIAMHAVIFLGPRASSYAEAVASRLDRCPDEAAAALVGIGGTATPWIVGAIRHPSREVRVAALKAIESPRARWPARVGRPVLDALLLILDEADDEMSRLAADTLESCGYGGDDIVTYYQERLQRLGDVGRERLIRVMRSIRE